MRVYATWTVVTVALVFLVLAGFEAWSTRAQTADTAKKAWIGRKVLPKEDVVVRDDVGAIIYDMQSAIAQLNLPWVVQDVNGEWLRVGDHRKGQVKRSQVVTLDEAPAYYTHIINHDPNNTWAYNLRATAWQERGDLDLAISDYGELLRLEPNAIAYNNRAGAWADKKEYDKAIADFSEAIRLDPNGSDAYNNRGWVWRLKRDYDKAIADYDQAIRLDPNDAFAYRGRGIVWDTKEERDKAIRDYDRAIHIDPNFAPAYSARGRAWGKKKEYNKAIADFNQAIRLYPNETDAHSGLAWILATCPDANYRDGAEAVSKATRACELSKWMDVDDLVVLAAAAAEAGDFDSAIKHQQKAIELDQDSSELKEYLALFRQHKPIRD